MTAQSALALLDSALPAHGPPTVAPAAVARLLNVSIDLVYVYVGSGKLPEPARLSAKTRRFAVAELRPALLTLLTGGAA